MTMPANGYTNCTLHPFSIEDQVNLIKEKPILLEDINVYRNKGFTLKHLSHNGFMFYGNEIKDERAAMLQEYMMDMSESIIRMVDLNTHKMSFNRSIEYSLIKHSTLCNTHVQLFATTKQMSNTPVGDVNVVVLTYSVFHKHNRVDSMLNIRTDIENNLEKVPLFTFSRVYYIDDPNTNIFHGECGLIFDIKKKFMSKKMCKKFVKFAEIPLADSNTITRTQTYKYATPDISAYFNRTVCAEYAFKNITSHKLSDLSIILDCDTVLHTGFSLESGISMLNKFISEIRDYTVHPVSVN